MADDSINLTIKAKDEASSSILNVLKSVGLLSAGFSLGTEVTKIFDKAIAGIEETFTSTIEAFDESQKVAAQLEAVLRSTGDAAGYNSTQLLEMSKSLQALTTYDDESITSAENLLLTFTNIGHDIFPQATQTVLDMSTALGQDLKSSAVELGKALQDPIQGVTALQRVGVNFTNQQQELIQTLVDSGKGMEAQKLILSELAKEFGGSAVAQAQTFAGQMEQVRNRINDVQEQVGQGLTPVLGNLVSSLSDVAGQMLGTTDVARVTFDAFRNLAEGAYALVNAIIQIGVVIEKTFSYVAEFVSVAGIFNKDAKKGFEDSRDSLTSFASSSQDSFDKFVAKNEDASEALDALEANSKNNTDLLTSHAANFSKSTNDDVDKIEDKYKELGDSIDKMRQTAVDDLAALSKAHHDDLDASRDRIEDLEKSLDDLTDSYDRAGAKAATAFSQQSADDAAGIADEIVKQQDKIKDLQMQAGMETDPQKKVALAAELKQEQDSYADNAAFIQSQDAAVVAARARASETDFQRAIDDYQAKRAQAQQEYDDERADAARDYDARTAEINAEIAQENSKMDKERASYLASRTAINKILADSEQLRLDTTAKTTKEVLALIDSEINRYNQLSDAINRAAQGKPTQIAPSASKITSHEFGGIVPGAIGTPQPIIAHGGETVIPSGQAAGGGSSYQVIINNPQVRSSSDVALMRAQIEEALRDVVRGNKLPIT